ncbi:MAG: hypothetical protein QNL68_08915 [Akkermansiaceae bacterium]
MAGTATSRGNIAGNIIASPPFPSPPAASSWPSQDWVLPFRRRR